MAEDYLKDLVDRNLILVCKHRSNGKIRSFRIHDLLRELCLKVAHKEKFFCVVKEDSIPQDIYRERRVIFHNRNILSCLEDKVFRAVQSSSFARSLICHDPMERFKYRLLRVYNNTDCCCYPEVGFQNQHVNQRYADCWLWKLPSSISLIWNLQTLVLHTDHDVINAPLEIWKMTQLRHVKCFKICLPDPPPSDDKYDSVVFRNLQTLSLVNNFRLSEEICKRLPNIRKLCMTYDFICRSDSSYYDNLLNLGHLKRLESVYIECFFDEFSISKLKDAFPGSLIKLIFESRIPDSEEMSMIVGSLVVLKLRGWHSICQFQKWSCVEGGFLGLKYLSIQGWPLKSWTLDEMPSGIGEIPTLQLIRLQYCKESLVISAMKMKEEQESFGNYDLQIQVTTFLTGRDKLMERVKAEGLSIKDIIFIGFY